MIKIFTQQEEINAISKINLTTLKEIEINGLSDIFNVSFLQNCVQLEKLKIRYLNITSFPLTNAKKLKYIFISSYSNLHNLNDLENCLEINEVIIFNLNIYSINTFQKLNELIKLTIYNCINISDQDTLRNTTVECLSLEQLQLSSIDFLNQMKKLKHLHLAGLPNIKNLEVLNDCTQIEEIQVINVNIESFPTIQNLKKVVVESCSQPQTFKGIENCQKIKIINIDSLNISNIVYFTKLKQITEINIVNFYNIVDYDTLEHCNNLAILTLSQTNISSIFPIIKQQNLQTLILKDNTQLSYELQIDIQKNVQDIQQFQSEHKKAKYYKNYKMIKLNEQQLQMYNDLKTKINTTQMNIVQFKHNINNFVFQSKVKMVEILKMIFQHQKQWH